MIKTVHFCKFENWDGNHEYMLNSQSDKYISITHNCIVQS